MNSAVILVCALLLDAVMGEPRWLWNRLPHPAVLMGRMIGWADARLNTGPARRLMGVATLLGVMVVAAAIGLLAAQLGALVEVLLAAILLAQRSLVDHVAAVARGLRMSVQQGRRDVAMIVSRDTAAMDEAAVARSAIESAAENLSDGVIAPAFWFLIGGLPGMMIYKVVNTADSMIGYRTPRHEAFGWAAARMDDALNWIPARLTALLIALPARKLRAWPAIKTDAAQHRSPNAGWPEAAMARAITVALAGPRAYDGVMQPFAWVNPQGKRALTPGDIDAAISRLWQAWAIMVGLALVLGLLTM